MMGLKAITSKGFIASDRDWKRYVSLSCITLISVLLAVGFVNYSMDPSHLFNRGSYERKVATILSSGSNAVITTNYNQRLVQLYYVNNLKSPFDVIVLGSSRGMRIRYYHFVNRSFFNHSVSMSSIEDFIAIYQMYLDRGFVPSTVVMSLDPWMLNKNNTKEWQSIEKYYETFVSTHNGSAKRGSSLNSVQLNKCLNLISFGYFRASFKSLLSSVSHGESHNEPLVTMEDDMEFCVIRYDGSLSYHKSFREMSHEDVEKDAIKWALADLPNTRLQFRELDKKAIYNLEMLVDDMLRKGIEIVFLFLPFHPSAYQTLLARQEPGIIDYIQSQFSEIARIRGIRTVGSYNPSDIGLSGIDFLDAAHPKESAVDKIWQIYDVPKIIK